MKRLFDSRWKFGFFRRIATWIARHSPPCTEMSRLASAALDRALTWRERRDRLVHFLICDFCLRYSRQLRLLRTMSLRWAAEHRDPSVHSLHSEARQRIKARLIEACRRGAPHRPDLER